MRTKVLLTTTMAALAVSSSLALAGGNVPLNEHARGSFASDVGGSSLAGTVTNGSSPISHADFSSFLQFDESTLRFTRACPGGRFRWTAEVTLGSGADTLVKDEKGTACVAGDSDVPLVLPGTYTVNGAQSTGIYKGASGTGSASITLQTEGGSPGESGTFTSDESGGVILRKTGEPKPVN